MRAPVSWVLARLLLGLGLLLLGGAAYSRYRMAAARLDKEAIYLFGRWLDAVWQVQVPLVCAGVSLLGIGVLLLRVSAASSLPGEGLGRAAPVTPMAPRA